MDKTEKELQELKEKVEELSKELNELSEEELEQVSGGHDAWREKIRREIAT